VKGQQREVVETLVQAPVLEVAREPARRLVKGQQREDAEILVQALVPEVV
jgi:hypothetical protein